MSNQDDAEHINETETAKAEWICLFVVLIIVFPLIATFLIGAYGFIVWMAQIFIFGPPGSDDCGIGID